MKNKTNSKSKKRDFNKDNIELIEKIMSVVLKILDIIAVILKIISFGN